MFENIWYLISTLGDLLVILNLQSPNKWWKLGLAMMEIPVFHWQRAWCVVFMVRGIFNKTMVPVCSILLWCTRPSNQLCDPFWEAVGCVKNCGLKECKGFDLYLLRLHACIWVRSL